MGRSKFEVGRSMFSLLSPPTADPFLSTDFTDLH